ncbi:hypothetical protein KT99_08013 [Shewanella benthica KT99]|uniref:Uncharacterized protein n=1 Tax=Shewanella benthica KT99 TaxID=314608 RepID=A9D9J8_9GAMM|nr:hypothetical protein KT99_08013 [Shewanella benthica KT99]
MLELQLLFMLILIAALASGEVLAKTATNSSAAPSAHRRLQSLDKASCALSTPAVIVSSSA